MYRSIRLPNGARILTQRIPGVRSAALGFFVGAGSRHELASENGAAHFIEHMSFKGTATRSAGVRPVPLTRSRGVSNRVMFRAPRSMMSVSFGET